MPIRLALSLSLAWVLAYGAASGGEPVASKIETILQTPGFADAHWGLLAIDAKSGEVVYERNADQMFCPASVAKLYSTSAAWLDLGPDYRFQTPLLRRGEIDKDGVLRGDLILSAQGDLSLGGRTLPDGTLAFQDNDHTYAGGNLDGAIVGVDPLAGLDHLAREAAASGLKRVEGDVLIDDRLFETAASSGSGPSRVTPILINDNLVDVVATPGAKAGDPARVRIVPETSFVSYDVLVTTVAEGKRPRLVVTTVGSRRFEVRGRIPVGSRAIVKNYEVEEPAAFARALLIESLRRRGVRIDASPLGNNDEAKLPKRSEVVALPKVAEYTSPPFREYVKVILKVSLNLHASTLPLLVAAHHGEKSYRDGLRREGELLKTLGVDVSKISFGGGAGGERADLTTPRQTVALLRGLAKRPDFPSYEAALPVLGRDGTLAKAVPADSPARGHARAKTGTYYVGNEISGKSVLTSKSLAGYLETAGGRPLIVTFFVSNVPLGIDAGQGPVTATTAGRLLGRLCEAFYSIDATAKVAEKPAATKE